jgi:hypothetical protein
MMEPMTLDQALLQPYTPRCFEERVGPNHVCLDESVGTLDRAIDVGLRSKVHDSIESVFAKQSLDQGAVANVPPNEAKFGPPHRGLKVGCIAGVSQRIEYHKTLARIVTESVVNEVRADEAGTAGDQDSSHA